MSIEEANEIKDWLTKFVGFCKKKGVRLCKYQGESLQKGQMNLPIPNNEINTLMLEFLEKQGFEVKSEEELREMLREMSEQ